MCIGRCRVDGWTLYDLYSYAIRVSVTCADCQERIQRTISYLLAKGVQMHGTTYVPRMPDAIVAEETIIYHGLQQGGAVLDKRKWTLWDEIKLRILRLLTR